MKISDEQMQTLLDEVKQTAPGLIDAASEDSESHSLSKTVSMLNAVNGEVVKLTLHAQKIGGPD